MKSKWLEEGVLSKELTTVAPVNAQLQIIDRVLQANWGSESLEGQRDKARR